MFLLMHLGVLVIGIPTGMVIQDLMEGEVGGKRNVSISSTTIIYVFEEIEDGVLEFSVFCAFQTDLEYPVCFIRLNCLIIIYVDG